MTKNRPFYYPQKWSSVLTSHPYDPEVDTDEQRVQKEINDYTSNISTMASAVNLQLKTMKIKLNNRKAKIAKEEELAAEDPDQKIDYDFKMTTRTVFSRMNVSLG